MISLALKDIKPPMKIEWTWLRDNRGSIVRRAVVVEKRGRNLRTDEGDWLWWPTINRYGDVQAIPAASEEETEMTFPTPTMG